MLGITICGAGLTLYSAIDLVRHPVGLGWLILVALTVASGWAMLTIPAMPISFSISDIFNIVAALLFGPSAGAISAALDGLVVTSRFANTRTLDRILFNMAAPTIATWGAAKVFFALGGGHSLVEGPLALVRLFGLLAVFGAIDFGLNSGLVATAVAFERRLPIFPVWREHFAGMWITYFGGIFGAMLLMVLSRFHTLDILVLLVPLPVILYVTFRHAIGRAEDHLNHLEKVNRVYVGGDRGARARRRCEGSGHARSHAARAGPGDPSRAHAARGRGGTSGDQGRSAASRRRQAGDSRAHPEQAGTPDAGGVRHHEAPCRRSARTSSR